VKKEDYFLLAVCETQGSYSPSSSLV